MKVYLGDSVYVETDGSMLMLTTENGTPDDPSNTICLEAEVFLALREYAERFYAEYAAERFDENPPSVVAVDPVDGVVEG